MWVTHRPFSELSLITQASRHLTVLGCLVPPPKKEGENLLNKWAVGWKEKPGLLGMELEHGKLHSMGTTKTLLRICDIVICQRTIYI